MRKLKFEMQVSVDGFAADSEGSTGWMTWNWGEEWRWDDALRALHNDLLATSDCLLISGEMAREGFFDHWAEVAAQADNPQSKFAAAIVAMRKLVFSRTLKSALWRNAEIVAGDAVKTIVSGSRRSDRRIPLLHQSRCAGTRRVDVQRPRRLALHLPRESGRLFLRRGRPHLSPGRVTPRHPMMSRDHALSPGRSAMSVLD
jgi:hypothetical protein